MKFPEMTLRNILIGTATLAGVAVLFLNRTQLVTGSQQLIVVTKAFAQSKGVLYSWGGGHSGYSWPSGGKGSMGGKGWDCSSWVMAVIKMFAPNSRLAQWAGERMPTGTEIWQFLGSPKNGTTEARAGDLVFWASDKDLAAGRLTHIGFLLPANRAVSAFGGGPSTNADNPKAAIREHGTSKKSTGLNLIGTASWL